MKSPSVLNVSVCRRVLPVFWSANYCTLAPGENVVVSVEARLGAGYTSVVMRCNGWNTARTELPLRPCRSSCEVGDLG